MNDWDDLRYLLAVHEHKNMKRAAQALGADPTTVSRHVKRLAEKTKSTLISLGKDGTWRTTKAGRRFVEVARVFERQLEELCEDDAPALNDEIVVSTLEFVVEDYLAARVPEIHGSLGGARISLEADDRTVSLAYGEADFAIRLGRPTDGRLIVSKIGEIELGIFAPSAPKFEGWIGLPEKYDWTPEMRLGFEFFQGPPTVRLASFRGIRDASHASGLPCISPVKSAFGLMRVEGSSLATREVWSVLHENRKHDARLAIVRDWAKTCFAEDRGEQAMVA